LMGPGIVDQDAPHHLRCHLDELSAALPVDLLLLDQSQRVNSEK